MNFDFLLDAVTEEFDNFISDSGPYDVPLEEVEKLKQKILKLVDSDMDILSDGHNREIDALQLHIDSLEAQLESMED